MLHNDWKMSPLYAVEHVCCCNTLPFLRYRFQNFLVTSSFFCRVTLLLQCLSQRLLQLGSLSAVSSHLIRQNLQVKLLVALLVLYILYCWGTYAHVMLNMSSEAMNMLHTFQWRFFSFFSHCYEVCIIEMHWASYTVPNGKGKQPLKNNKRVIVKR